MAGEKILLIDDELEKLELTVMNLTTGGFKVLTAVNGLSGIEVARKEIPDLILLDINMPGMDGIETCRILKRDPETRGIPVVMLTCNEDLDFKLEGLGLGADDYLIKGKIDYRELSARVKAIIQRTRELRGCSPLTGLPGNASIDDEIARRLRDPIKPWAVVYADLDNFKAFNDTYGFALGDDVIRLVANTMVRAIQEYGSAEDFVGHIGGDDLIFITTPDRVEEICSAVIADFDRAIVRFFSPEDQSRGYFVGQDREGHTRQFKFVTVTLAVVFHNRGRFASPAELAKWAGEVKHHLKGHPGSKWGY